MLHIVAIVSFDRFDEVIAPANRQHIDRDNHVSIDDVAGLMHNSATSAARATAVLYRLAIVRTGTASTWPRIHEHAPSWRRPPRLEEVTLEV